MFFALEEYGGYLLGYQADRHYQVDSAVLLLHAAHIKGGLAAKVALVACFGLGLVTGLRKLAIRLFLVFEKRSAMRKNSFALNLAFNLALNLALNLAVGLMIDFAFDLFGSVHFCAFLLLFGRDCQGQLFFNELLLHGNVF